MLHDLETLKGSTVIASDGEIGKAGDFLFDDQSWTIRYMSVDVRAWLSRRDVVLAIAAVDHPDWTKRTFQVHLTKEQVHNSPEVDAEKPVSRQQQIAMEEYFGPLAGWVDREFGGLSSMPTGRNYPLHTKEDSHLRSVRNLSGYAVWAEDGEVGRLTGFILSDSGWRLSYLDVSAGDWLLNRSVLIPTRSVESISWADRRVNLHHCRESL
jgi:uncharacterized protein YrrD